MLLEEGLRSLQQQEYSQAVELLEEYCQQSSNLHSPFYLQAKMALARAYRGNNQREDAISLAKELDNHLDTEVSHWAKGFLTILTAQEKVAGITTTAETPRSHPKAGRAGQMGVKLAAVKGQGNLAFAVGGTIILLSGIILTFCFALIFQIDSDHPLTGLIIAIVLTLVFNGVIFFLSPWLMDVTQQCLYKTRWVSLAEIKRDSPEAAAVIGRVCREKRIDPPKLGIIEDPCPTAFTYGSLPSNARLVVSRGLFTYLDDDEVATVYAHELGHIIHWDFALMTVLNSFIQLTYSLYIFARDLGRNGQDGSKVGVVAIALMVTAYIFYQIGTFFSLYLSRVREYFADHFSAQVTGNPNGLSRALVKIAYGLVEESQQGKKSSSLLASTRVLGITDPKAAITTGTVYRIALEPRKVGQVFLWDLFNPWAGWMELSSTHPLTGKRIRALTTYAEQMELATEFNMSEVIREGNQLNRKKLYQNFFFELSLYNAQWIGLGMGLLIGILAWLKFASLGMLGLSLIGFGLGTLIKTWVMYPNLKKAHNTDLFSLMSDPYANPLKGHPVKLKGQLIGRGEAGYQMSSDFMLQDATGMIFTRYSSRFGALGNFLFGWKRMEKLIGESVHPMGWFRRGISPYLDLVEMNYPNGTIKSYPRFWSLVSGIGSIVLGLIIGVIF